MATNILDRGIGNVQKAIEEDNKRNYAEAYKHYSNSLDYFMLALKYEKDEKKKSRIRSKIDEFLHRAEILKQYVDEQKRRKDAKPKTSSLNSADHIQRGTDLARRAFEEDGKQNYPEARKLYYDSLDYLMLALRYEKNEESKTTIQSTIEEYLLCIDILEKRLKSSEWSMNTKGKNEACGATGSTDIGPPKSFLQRGIENVQKAIEEDNKRNYAEAYKHYSNSLDCFMLALKYEKDEKDKSRIRSKIDEYLQRAEVLKQYLDEQTRSKDTIPKISLPSSADSNYIQRGTDLARRALEEDGKQNNAEASKLYSDSRDYLMLALKFEKNEKFKVKIRSMIEEYSLRIDALKKCLKSSEGSMAKSDS